MLTISVNINKRDSLFNGAILYLTQHCVSTDTMLVSQQLVAASCSQQVSVLVQGVKDDSLSDKVQKSVVN